MHHKRKKPKSARAGCLMCKPHKHQAVKKTKSAKKLQEKKADLKMKEDL